MHERILNLGLRHRFAIFPHLINRKPWQSKLCEVQNHGVSDKKIEMTERSYFA